MTQGEPHPQPFSLVGRGESEQDTAGILGRSSGVRFHLRLRGQGG